jgi:hypothetical protein
MAADSGAVPDRLLPAMRVGVFWASLPFIGLLLSAERISDGKYLEAAAWFCGAIASIVAGVYLDRLIPRRFQAKPKNLEYLSSEDSELGTAIRNMVWRSAWAKWYASQYLATDDHRPASEAHMMHVGASLVLDALMDGQLEARGRNPGQMEYEAIPQTHWRSSALHMVEDKNTFWRMVLFPRGGAEINPDGVVVAARDAAAKQRTDELAAYDSLIVNSRQFERMWPRRDKEADAATKHLLKKAKKAGADPAEIQKLARN